MRGLLILAAGALAACPLSIEPSSSTVIGDTCRSAEDCGLGYCATSAQGGYCTMDCSSEPCPVGAQCVEQQPPLLLPKVFSCMRTCRVTADCGRAGVACRPCPFATTSDLVCN